jgi:oligoendopeptidase F
MTVHEDADLNATDVAWDLDPLVGGEGQEGVTHLLEQAEALTGELEQWRGRIGTLEAPQLAQAMSTLGEIQDRLGRAGSWVSLRFSVDTSDPAHGAAMQKFQEQATELSTRLIFLELEWAEVPEARASVLLESVPFPFAHRT